MLGGKIWVESEEGEGSTFYSTLPYTSEQIKEKFAKEIIAVTCGTEAVETCRVNPDIDLILMDIQMAKMNGYEATRQMRKFNKDVIIIAQTAFALEGDREKAMAAGCDDYITKPIKIDELLKKIEKLLS